MLDFESNFSYTVLAYIHHISLDTEIKSNDLKGNRHDER